MLFRFGRKLSAATIALSIIAWPAHAVGLQAGGKIINEPTTSRDDGAASSSTGPGTQWGNDRDGSRPDRASRARELSPPPQETRQLGQPAPARTTARADESGESSGRHRWLDPRLGEVVRVAGALAVVLGLLVLLRAMLRRVGSSLEGGGRPSGVAEVVARYPVARGQQLVVLKLGRRIVLLHQTKTAMTTLSEMSDPEEVAALLARIESTPRRGAGGRFQALLHRFANEGRTGHAFPPRTVAGADAEGNEVIDLTRRPHRAGPSWGGTRGSP
ncbi:MAG: flagellar biosynthetic protein FliO [Planctomycetota bacterium]|jgi:flagellar biogenesis protein FliO